MIQLAVLFGGKSGEHAVSCLSAASVLENIRAEQYSILKIGITADGRWFQTEATPEEIRTGAWEHLPKKKAILSPDTKDHGFLIFDGDTAKLHPIDVIFPVMHGDFCEDGCLQGLCELSGIRYVGCGVCASAIGMDKTYTKALLRGAGIPVVNGITLTKAELEDAKLRVRQEFTYPVFVKPVCAGSSLGACKVEKEDDLPGALEAALLVDDRVLVEEYIDAREIECAILGNAEAAASVLGEIVPMATFYDYDEKYKSGTAKLLIPAPLTEAETRQIQDYAKAAFHAIGARGFSRVDFFKDKKTGRIVLNEINTIPGFTSISMYPKLWVASGISYPELIDRLIALA